MPIQWQTARTQVAVLGRVTDAASGAPLRGVRVEVTAGPAAFTDAQAIRARQHGAAWAAADRRPGRTRTGEDGGYHFEDLPPGAYTLAFSLPGEGTRWGTATANATVAAAGDGTLQRAVANAALAPTRVSGSVRDAGGAAVAMAEVRMHPTGERTWTDADGHWSLRAVEAGTRQLRVTARGFAPASANAVIPAPGAAATQAFALQPG
jgi:hypothetical protein